MIQTLIIISLASLSCMNVFLSVTCFATNWINLLILSNIHKQQRQGFPLSFFNNYHLSFISSSTVMASSLSDDTLSIRVEQLLQQALSFHKQGDIDNAIASYEDLLKYNQNLKPTTVASLYGNLGSLYLTKGLDLQAKQQFELAIEFNPESSQAYYNLAILQTTKLAMHKPALTNCIKALKLDRNNYKIIHLMGNIMQSLDRPTDAEKYFIQAEQMALESQQDKVSSISESSNCIENNNPLRKLSLLQGYYSNQLMESFEISEEDRTIEVKVLSKEPLIFHVSNFLTSDACQEIINCANSKTMEKSFIMGGDSSNNSPYRSSFNTWIGANESVVQRLHELAAITTGLPLSFVQMMSEELQVVKYEGKGEFKPHHDSSAFHKRLLTMLIYLNDCDTEDQSTFDGTWFPFVNNSSLGNIPETIDNALKLTLDYYDSRIQASEPLRGLMITPKKGDMVMFFNHVIDDQLSTFNDLDIKAIHAGLPVQEHKEKWIANLWITNDLEKLVSYSDN